MWRIEDPYRFGPTCVLLTSSCLGPTAQRKPPAGQADWGFPLVPGMIPESVVHLHHVFRGRALLALDYVELHFLALLKGFET